MPLKTRNRLTDFTPALTPVWHVALADVPVNTSPVEVHAVALPAAGTYLVELSDLLEVATLGGARSASWVLGTTNFVAMSMTGISFRSGVAQVLDNTQTTNNHTFSVASITSNNRVRAISTGFVTVSAAAVLTAQLSISADTATIRAGSCLKARRYA